MSILAYVESTTGTLKKSAFEVISYAKAIGKEIDTPVVALSIGDVSEEALKTLGQYGADKILSARTAALKQFANRAYATVIADAAQQEGANLVVLSGSFSGKDLAPRLAAKLQAGLANDVVGLPKISGDALTVKRTAFSGKAFASVELHTPVKVLALTPNAHVPLEMPGKPEMVHFSAETKAEDLTAVVKEIIRATDHVALPEAEIVVAGGRGLKGPENWSLIEDLASALGAATACSKPVSDAGWRPHEEHVGQTGTTISPNLYIAIGISGAIQHLAGVNTAKTIVVINKDPDAPFFKVADYGIIGDAFEVVPKLILAIKALKEK